MAGETTITIVGNLVDNPELRYTPSGDAVANFRVASTPRVWSREDEQWSDGETLFLTCTVWRTYAENVAESLTRGNRVIVHGRLKQRSYENNDGERRTVYEIDVEDVGPALRFNTATLTRPNAAEKEPVASQGAKKTAGRRR